MEKKIKSIEKGFGDDSTYFTTNELQKKSSYWVEEIKLIVKPIGKGYHNDITIEIFCGYIDGDLIFEIERNSALTIMYYKS